jgi:hypothetical protein
MAAPTVVFEDLTPGRDAAVGGQDVHKLKALPAPAGLAVATEEERTLGGF